MNQELDAIRSANNVIELPSARFNGLPILLADGLICGYCALFKNDQEFWIGRHQDLLDAMHEFKNATAVLCHNEGGELRKLRGVGKND